MERLEEQVAMNDENERRKEEMIENIEFGVPIIN